jgi:soluble lytic murein transglycosylase
VHRFHFFRTLLLVTAITCLVPAAGRAAQSSIHTHKTVAKTSARKTAGRRKKHAASPRLRRMRQAFVASATLKPMARQLLQDRTSAAYAGVESYARAHDKEDAGALAYLLLGYAHVLDKDYAKAIDPLARARANAGDLGDYVGYYLGVSYLDTGRIPQATATFSTFDKSFPRSLLIRDVHVAYANALVAGGHASEAIDLLERDRQPARADLELALGRAYEAAHEAAKAGGIFHNLYYTMPLSSEADAARAELNKLGATAGLPPVTMAERRTRIDLLVKGKRYNEAADEYRALADEVTPAERPGIQLAMVDALRHAGDSKEARKVLDAVLASSPEVSAQRWFELGELERAADHDDAFLHTVEQLRQVSPNSPWLEQALISQGNIYLLRHDYDHALDSYRECQQRFPSGTRADYAYWKVAWLSLRQGRAADAKKALEDQIALYPSSPQLPAALYWRARLAEDDGDPSMARAFYQMLFQRFHNYYYALLARDRLARIKDGPSPHYALLDHVPPLRAGTNVTAEAPPDDNLRIQKAHLLANGALVDFAARELKAAAEEDKGTWLAPEMVQLYQDAGRYDQAIEYLKHNTVDYFAVDLSNLPRAYWEGLFPKPYWYDLQRFSAGNGLDPYLVAALIRQESEFNPNAVSRANAVGLMQLLPKVGSQMAKQEKLRSFNVHELFTPAINLQLGTHYFRSTVDKFGAVEYALAAYNAGDDRVAEWQGMAKYRDVAEFVESIPFTETREYVQAIVRNANMYKQLYGAQ